MIDIEIQQIPTKEHALEPYVYKLVHDCGYNEVDAIERKRELEQAQKVVFNIMKRIREITEIYPDSDLWGKKDVLEELHKVLKDTMK